MANQTATTIGPYVGSTDSAYFTMEIALRPEMHTYSGGLGVLAEYGSERWLREAMILAIWEGTSHRQILDGMEVMEKKRAHKLLFGQLEEHALSREIEEMEEEIERHLRLRTEEREARAEGIFRKLAIFTAETLARRSIQA